MQRVLTLCALPYIIKLWQFRNKNAYAVAANGIRGSQNHLRLALNAVHHIGINLKSNSKNNKPARCVSTEPAKETTMSIPSQLPNQNIPQTETLLHSFLSSCQSRGLSRETVRWYKELLGKFSNMYPLLPLEPEPIEAFIASYSHTTDERRHGAYRAVRAFYNWLEKREDIPNPISKVTAPRRRPTEKPALTRAELKQLLEFPGHTPDIRTVLYLLADTGARIGEVYNVSSDCIYQDSVKLRGKTGERIVPISPEVRQMLIDLGPGQIFQYSLFNLRRKVARAFKAAGVSGTSHTLRHTFCTLWRGSDLCLKTITGHRSWAMIENYSHRKLEKAAEEHKTSSPLAVINGNNGISNNNQVPDMLEALHKLIREYRKEELANFLPYAEGLPGVFRVTLSKYAFHSVLYNFANAVVQEQEGVLQDGAYKATVYLLKHGFWPKGFTKKDCRKFADFSYTILYYLTKMFEAFAKEEYSTAMLYRQIADLKEEPEFFNLFEPETVKQE